MKRLWNNAKGEYDPWECYRDAPYASPHIALANVTNAKQAQAFQERWGALFAGVLHDLKQVLATARAYRDTLWLLEKRPAEGAAWLTDAVQNCRIVLEYSEAGFRQRYRFSSLYECIVLMAIDDFALGGARLQICASPRCRQAFRATRPNERYCSTKCRHREEMRRYREKGE